MAINTSAISAATTTATALSNLILVTPNSKGGYQPETDVFADDSVPNKNPSFVFDYEGENTVLLESDITDHFLENNTAIQDQIALKPEMVTVHGFIAELNDIAPDILEPLKFIKDKLTVLEAYTPKLTAAAILAYNEAVQLYSVASLAIQAAVSAWSSITGSGSKTQTKQQVAFSLFYGYWQNRTLFTIQTPWNKFSHMAIKSLRAVQDADTRMITDFEVTFKKMKFATTVVTGGKVGQGRFNIMGADFTDNGASTPVQSTPLKSAMGTSFPGSVA